MDQQQFFTEEELKEYENLISIQETELKKKADELQKQKEELQRQHDQLEAQKLEYHQVIFCKKACGIKKDFRGFATSLCFCNIFQLAVIF